MCPFYVSLFLSFLLLFSDFCLAFDILSTVFLGRLDLHSMAQKQGLGCSVWNWTICKLELAFIPLYFFLDKECHPMCIIVNHASVIYLYANC